MRLATVAAQALITICSVHGQTDFRAIGNNLIDPAIAWEAERGSITLGEAGWKADGPALGTAMFSTRVGAQPGKEYFFSAEVRSADRVVFFVGGLSMSYHLQGDWQTVCGLVQSGGQSEFELRIQLRSLTGNDASMELRNLVLQQVERPETAVSAQNSGSTVLVENGAAAASIIYPGKSDSGLAQAKLIQEAIREVAGVDLPIISDADGAETDFPILKPKYAAGNLILIGRLATNRAIWPAYNRFLSGVDGYYPGGDGFVVHTAANVFGNSKNHIIAGGSTDAGVQRAVDALVATIRSNEALEDESSFQLPWLLEVELGGDCKDEFSRDDALWANPDDPQLPQTTPGYGRLARWYRNAMGYYWSGQKSYLDRLKSETELVLSDNAYSHHYLAEFFVRAYGMLVDSSAFTAEEKRGLDDLILSNFLDFLTPSGDLNWMTVFSPPYHEIALRNRHQISPWYADLVMARFLDRNVDLSGMLADLVQFRLSEKASVMDALVADRNGPTLPGIAAGSDYEEIPGSLFRYALETDAYADFFGTGLAEEALTLDRLNHVSGRFIVPACDVDLPSWLGVFAHMTRDGQYRWLAENIPFRIPNFQSRVVAGVRRYDVGNDVQISEPDPSWSGVRVMAQPMLKDQTDAKTYEQFPLLVFRGGFRPDDDLLLLSGVNPSVPPGSLNGILINGAYYFGGSHSDENQSSSRVTTNGASVIRLSGYRPEAEATIGLVTSKVDWLAELDDAWGAGISTPISSDMDWQRDIIRLGNGTYLFADTFRPKRDGRYLLRVNWNTGNTEKSDNNQWVMATNRGQIQLALVGGDFNPTEFEDRVAWESARSMKTGDQATVWTLVQRIVPGSHLWRPEGASEDRLELKGPSDAKTLWLKGRVGKDDWNLAAISDATIIAFGVSDPNPQGFLPSIAIQKEGHITFPPDAAIAIADLDAQVRTAAEALTPAPEAADKSDPDAQTSEIADASSSWQELWTYDGLKRPTRLRFTEVSENEIELHAPAFVEEIRSKGPTSGGWVATHLPNDIQLETEEQAGEWLKVIGARQSRPSPRTGNYGEVHVEAHADESLFPEFSGKVTRIRAEGAGDLLLFGGSERQARHPVRLDLIESATGAPQVLFARTELFPAFPRPLRLDDMSFALLDSTDGKPLAEVDLSGPVQAFLVAEQQPGKTEIFAVKADARIEVYGMDGKLSDTIDHYQQSLDFDTKHRTGATRHPLGGHFMPFSIGFWRSSPGKPAKIVLGRYGSAAFLDENRQLEGLRSLPSYAFPAMLPAGRDFSGDGKDEMLLLERDRLSHVSGDPTPTVSADGRPAWPQVYDLLSVAAPKDASSPRLAGEPVHIFAVIESWGDRPSSILACRSNYLAIYDAAERRWIFSWRPPAPIAAAGVVRESENQITVLLSTIDRLLWTCTIDRRRIERPAIQTELVPFVCNEIRAPASLDGTALMATNTGLILRNPDASNIRLRPGIWRAALFLPTEEDGSIRVAASDDQGAIRSFIQKDVEE